MKQQIRQAILLSALLGCAGCTHLHEFHAPREEPAQHFPQGEYAQVEELPGPTLAQSDSPSATRDQPDPVLRESVREDWPGGSVAEDYEPADSVTENGQPISFGSEFRADCRDMLHSIGRDYRNYYSWDNLGMLAVGFGAGAVVANTDWDENIHTWYQDKIRSHSSDEAAHVMKYFGEGGYEATIMITAWMMGNMFNDTRWGDCVSEWGARGMRTIIVGAPPMLLMQYVIGASRPLETSADSSWKPFNDNNGVSGHAFMGAVPLITAAKMSDNWFAKAGFYTLSTFPGWTRINDDAHFTSQVFLGWWMAYWAATAVDWTEHDSHDWHIMPLPMENGAGMAITFQY
jgi:hypothetical protein